MNDKPYQLLNANGVINNINMCQIDYDFVISG